MGEKCPMASISSRGMEGLSGLDQHAVRIAPRRLQRPSARRVFPPEFKNLSFSRWSNPTGSTPTLSTSRTQIGSPRPKLQASRVYSDRKSPAQSLLGSTKPGLKDGSAHGEKMFHSCSRPPSVLPARSGGLHPPSSLHQGRPQQYSQGAAANHHIPIHSHRGGGQPRIPPRELVKLLAVADSIAGLPGSDPLAGCPPPG